MEDTKKTLPMESISLMHSGAQVLHLAMTRWYEEGIIPAPKDIDRFRRIAGIIIEDIEKYTSISS